MEPYQEHSRAILTSPKSGYKPNRTGVDSISLFGYQNEYNLEDGFPLMTTKKMSTDSITHELIWFLKGETNIKYLVDNNVHIWDGNAFQHYLRTENLEEKFPIYSKAWYQAKETFIYAIQNDSEFAAKHGDLGPVYGKQWRHWQTSEGEEIDQIADAIEIGRASCRERVCQYV